MRKALELLLGCAVVAAADPAVQAVGIGTRAYGMAGNFTALAGDFSALFWNPAGLAFVPVREVHCAVDLDRQDTRTELAGTGDRVSRQRIRLSSAGLMRSVPTVRGGFGLALGFSVRIFLTISTTSKALTSMRQARDSAGTLTRSLPAIRFSVIQTTTVQRDSASSGAPVSGGRSRRGWPWGFQPGSFPEVNK